MGEDAGSRVYELYRQGCARLRDGNPGGAAELLELAVAEEPDSASLREALARAYLALRHLTQAREEFEAALVLHPTDDYAHFGVGCCYERQGRLAEAAKFYKLAHALAPKDDYQQALERVEARGRA